MGKEEIYTYVSTYLSSLTPFQITKETTQVEKEEISVTLHKITSFILLYKGTFNNHKIDKILSFISNYIPNYDSSVIREKINILLSFIEVYLPDYVYEIIEDRVTYTFDDLDDFIMGFFPEYLTSTKDYRILVTLLAVQAFKGEEILGKFFNLYNVPKTDDTFLPRLADTISFYYPPTYDYACLRTLLSYFNKIKRNRGQLSAMKQLLRLLYTTQDEIIKMDIDDYLDIDIYECDSNGNHTKEDYATNDINTEADHPEGKKCNQSGILRIEYSKFPPKSSKNREFTVSLLKQIKPAGFKLYLPD